MLRHHQEPAEAGPPVSHPSEACRRSVSTKPEGGQDFSFTRLIINFHSAPRNGNQWNDGLF